MFLTINGMSVPVASGSISETRPSAPPPWRGYGGGLNVDHRPPRRSWKVSTRRMAAKDADHLEALIAGLGESLPFEGSVYGERLRPLALPTPVVSFHPGVASDGRLVALESKYGGSIAIEPATTNLLTPVQRTIEGSISGLFTAMDGAVLSAATSAKYEQAQSLQVVTSAVVNGVRGGFRTVGVGTVGGTFVASCYAMSLTGGTVQCFTRNLSTGGVSALTTHALTPGVWQRVYAAPLAGFVLGNLACIEVLEDTPDSGLTFFVDALQVEAGTVHTSWANPSRAAGALAYDSSDLFRGLDGFSISCWGVGRPPGTGTNVVFNIPGALISGALFSALRITGNTTSLSIDVTDKDGRSQSASSGSVLTTTWFLTVIYRESPGVGENRLEVWVNGALVFSFLPTSLGALDLLNHLKTLEVGYDSSGPFYATGMLLDDFCLTPWAMSSSEVASVYAATTRLRRGPALRVEGSFIRGEVLECYGTIAPSSYQTFHAGAAGYDSSARSVAFSLEER